MNPYMAEYVRRMRAAQEATHMYGPGSSYGSYAFPGSAAPPGSSNAPWQSNDDGLRPPSVLAGPWRRTLRIEPAGFCGRGEQADTWVPDPKPKPDGKTEQTKYPAWYNPTTGKYRPRLDPATCRFSEKPGVDTDTGQCVWIDPKAEKWRPRHKDCLGWAASDLQPESVEPETVVAEVSDDDDDGGGEEDQVTAEAIAEFAAKKAKLEADNADAIEDAQRLNVASSLLISVIDAALPHTKDVRLWMWRQALSKMQTEAERAGVPGAASRASIPTPFDTPVNISRAGHSKRGTWGGYSLDGASIHAFGNLPASSTQSTNRTPFDVHPTRQASTRSQWSSRYRPPFHAPLSVY